MSPKTLIACFLATFNVAATGAEKERPDDHVEAAISADGSATVPQARMEMVWWKERHAKKIILANKGDIDLLFIGDSIIHSWENAGNKTFEKYYAHRRTLNLGYSGDSTQHVLWRLLNGELPTVVDPSVVNPKVAVLMIGTNNTGQFMNPAAETAAGIKAIIDLLRDRRPEMEILLLGIFPRGDQPEDQMRLRNEEINAIAKTYADGEKIHYLDLSKSFLADDGTLPKDIMPDALHPNAKGYAIWAAAMETKLAELGGWEKISP